MRTPESLVPSEHNLPKGSELAINELKEFKGNFDYLLRNFLASEIEEARQLRPEVSEFIEIAAEFVNRGGKRLRPAFLSKAYRGFGGKNEQVEVFAGFSVELLHSAALVHDDIIDNSGLRRGEPTVHKVIADRLGDESLGRALAIIVGDTLLAFSNKTMSIALNEAGENKFIMRTVRAHFDQMCIEINNGQYLDILGNSSSQPDMEYVEKVMEYKTARYTVEKPLLIGASLAGADFETQQKLSDYAIPLGVAFQVQDDILGMFGNEDRVGKPVDSDLKEGKRTILLLETLRRLAKRDATQELARLNSIVGNPDLTREDYLWAQKIVKKTGALDYTREYAKNSIDSAKLSVEQIDGMSDECRSYLIGIADYMLTREY